MLALFIIFSSIAIKCETTENAYDFQRDLEKFKEKYENQDFTSHRQYQKEPLDLPFFSFAKDTLEQAYNRSIIHQWPKDRKELIQIFEKHGAEAINKGYEEFAFNSPMYWAVRSNDFALVKFLLEHGGNPDLIGSARTLEMVKYLEENGADLDLSQNTIKYEIKNDSIRKYLENKKVEFNKQNQLLDAEIQQ